MEERKGVINTGLDLGKGAAEKVGEKIDHVIDKLSGKGPVEKAGERIDNAIKELKK